jgi:hypothetical protein
VTHLHATLDFDLIIRQLTTKFLSNDARPVSTRWWQGLEVSARPEMTPYELEDVTVETTIPNDIGAWAAKVDPNLPWAEAHFKERVSMVPHNPPPSHEIWPHAQSDNQEFTNKGKFSHTYPERFWPKFANDDWPVGKHQPHQGIRFRYGDLMDVVRLMHNDPHTRQAYLPVFFPEDTGAHHGQRIPCTLGYLFRYRRGRMNIVYYIRSCDFRRHFRDDVYMAGRLAQWMMIMLRDSNLKLEALDMGKLIMHISSLHIFEGDLPFMRQERNNVLGSQF